MDWILRWVICRPQMLGSPSPSDPSHFLSKVFSRHTYYRDKTREENARVTTEQGLLERSTGKEALE
ncbi:hypothetical protein I79_010793 [Cricetulus griseus]|uniref:Uncharacterized protein n=1 Tax=Cricetulus griseus TaxID=10029 RepID=G3HJF0_CRIGR|nr:hypothetical protein I79_010793 [Cricetulus griseus]